MSAGLLREAAGVLRERATAIGDHYVAFEVYDEDCAAFMATMTPAVGLALADWLDELAVGWSWGDDNEVVMDHDDNILSLNESVDSHAIKIAAAILGRFA